MTDQLELVEELEQLRSVLGAYERKRNHQLVKQKLMVKDNADAPRDALTKSYRKKNKDKFGGEHGIPAYRVEVFRF
jgi:hypothetical protein